MPFDPFVGQRPGFVGVGVAPTRHATAPIEVGNLAEGSMPQSTNLGSGGGTRTDRAPFALLRDVRSIQFAYHNNVLAFDGSTGTPNAFTIKVALELPTGEILPVFFGGTRSKAMAQGVEAVSDELVRDLPKGGGYFVRTAITVAANGSWPGSHRILPGYNRYGAAAGDQADSTNVDQFQTPSYPFCPTAIMGVPQAALVRTANVLLVADSIGAGLYQDSLNIQDSGDLGGYGDALTRARIPHVRWATGGARQEWVAQNIALIQRLATRARATHVFTNLSINSRSSTAGAWIATTRAMWDALATLGLPVIQTTIMPMASSTDNFATLGNQTPDATNPFRVELNNYIMTQPHSALCGVIPAHRAVEFDPDAGTGIWRVGMTGDGTHPGGDGHRALSDFVLPLIQQRIF